MSRIFKKLFLTYILVIAVSSVIIALFTDYVLREYYKDEIAHELEISALLVENNFRISVASENSPDRQSTVKKLEALAKARITVIDLNGNVIADSESDPKGMENHKNRPEIEKAVSGVTGKSIRYSDTLGMDMMYVAVPMRHRGRITGAVRLSMPLNQVNEKINGIHRIIIIAVFIGILIALLFSFAMAKSFVDPILIMKSAAEKISKGEFNHKINVKGNYELDQLGKSLNIMSEDLQKKISEIVKEKNEISAVLSSMSEGVLVVDKGKKIVLINPSLSKMLYFRFEDVIGKYYWEAIGNQEINGFIEAALTAIQPLKKDITILLPEEHNIDIQASAIHYDSGELFGIVCVFHDITQIRKLERMRSEFVANASHELKTPLTAIGGFVETLKEGAIEEKQEAKRFLDIIESNVNRLNNIVNDMMTISKSESKELKLNKNKTDVRKLIENVIVMCQEKTSRKKLTVNTDFPQNFPEINADEQKLEQIFLNLLDNAIKFTGENGKVTIKGEDDKDWIKIKFSDTGIGISKEHLSRIFERFYRVDTARSRDMGGTGLGLAIVKHLVQLHEGEISVESQPGKGSVFSVVLPK